MQMNISVILSLKINVEDNCEFMFPVLSTDKISICDPIVNRKRRKKPITKQASFLLLGNKVVYITALLGVCTAAIHRLSVYYMELVVEKYGM